MELSARYLRDDVEFKRAVRGYDMDEVDDLLDQVADWVDQMNERLRQVTERAARAEQRIAEGADTEDALRRTLVLAQRTADEAVREAEAQAERVLQEAEAKAASLAAEATAEARRVATDAQRQLRADIAALEKARAVLQADLAALEGFLAGERERIRELFSDQLRRLEAVTGATSGAAPPLHDVVVPPAPDAISSPGYDDAHDADADEELPDEAEEEHAEPEHEGDMPVVAGSDVDDEVKREPAVNDDPFLHELRKAVYDRAPLGPRQDEPVGDDGRGTDLDVPDRPRRGLRRRR